MNYIFQIPLTKMFGFKIIKMPLGIKLENQYAPSVPDISGSRREEAKLADIADP